MLQQYGPALLIQCKELGELAESLVAGWLEQYMFSGDADAHTKATTIGNWLADHGVWKTHSRFISRDALRAQGMIITDLEADQQLQDLLLSVFHATTITFDGAGAVKIIENHAGRAFIKSQRMVLVPPQAMQQPQVPQGTPPMQGQTPPATQPPQPTPAQQNP